MAVENLVVITAAQRATLMGWNGQDVAINPRAIDNVNPGIGLNINPDADGFDGGDVIELIGKYIAPKRIVDDPEYLTYAPDMVAMLLTLPWCMLEIETIFAPEEPI